MPKKLGYSKYAFKSSLRRRKPKRNMMRKSKRTSTKPNALVLTKPGAVIPRSAFGIFRSKYSFKVTGNTSDGATGQFVVKLNSPNKPFNTASIGTNITNVTNYDAANQVVPGYGMYVGSNAQLYKKCRVYKSTITVKSMGGLQGAAYRICIVPLLAGVTAGNFTNLQQYPYAKSSNYTIAYQPTSLSNSCTVSKIAGVPEATVMSDDLYVQDTSTVDPTTQYNWIIGWQSADGAQVASGGGPVFEISVDHYVRFELPNNEDVVS